MRQPEAEGPVVVETKHEDDGESPAAVLARQILDHPAPRPTGPLNKDESTRFVGTELKAWFQKSIEKLEELNPQFEQLVRDSNDEQQAEVLYWEAKTLSFIASEMREAGEFAMPTEWRSDEDLSGAYLRALTEATIPYYRRALERLTQCSGISQRAGEWPIECQAEVTRISGIMDGHERDAVKLRTFSSEPLSRVAADFEPRASQHLGRCDFRGSVEGDVSFRLPNAEEKLGTLEHAHIDSLTLSSESDKYHKAQLQWPLQGAVEVLGRLLYTTQRVQFVPGHIWHDAGDPVSARNAGHNQAELSAQLAYRDDLPRFTMLVPCSHLSLSIPRKSEREPESGSHHPKDGALLFDSPGGKVIGAVGRSFNLLKTHGEFQEVESARLGARFRGWIHRDSVQPAQFGMIGLLKADGQAPTHRTTRATELYVGTVATGLLVVPGVPLIAGESDGDLVEVSIFGLGRFDRAPFRLMSEDIERF